MSFPAVFRSGNLFLFAYTDLSLAISEAGPLHMPNSMGEIALLPLNIHPREYTIGDNREEGEMSERTILLVEDMPDDVVLTMTALQENHIFNKVAVAKDGVEALDYLFCQGKYATRLPGNPQLVLLDLKLPKLDGLEVLRRIRENPLTRRIPVVILTTSNEQQDMLRSYDLGANSFVRKPVDFADFLGVVKQLGIYWLALNETVED